MSRWSLPGKTAVVTGASSGIGAALARALAGAGARVVLFARGEEGLRETARRCADTGREPLVVTGDVTEPPACRRLVDRTLDRFGRLDLMVACAGVSMWARFDEIEDVSVLRRLMEVNYLGVVHPLHFALPRLEESGGMFAAVSSIQGKVGAPYHTGYAASKHAVQGFCDSLRMELRGSGVDVLTVLPHWVRGTRLRRRAFTGDGGRRGERAPQRGSDAVEPDDVARAVLDAIRKRKRSVTVPAWLGLLPLVAEAAPGLADRIVAGRVESEAGTAG